MGSCIYKKFKIFYYIIIWCSYYLLIRFEIKLVFIIFVYINFYFSYLKKNIVDDFFNRLYLILYLENSVMIYFILFGK